MKFYQVSSDFWATRLNSFVRMLDAEKKREHLYRNIIREDALKEFKASFKGDYDPKLTVTEVDPLPRDAASISYRQQVRINSERME
jgi:hypothetical protein